MEIKHTKMEPVRVVFRVSDWECTDGRPRTASLVLQRLPAGRFACRLVVADLDDDEAGIVGLSLDVLHGPSDAFRRGLDLLHLCGFAGAVPQGPALDYLVARIDWWAAHDVADDALRHLEQMTRGGV